MKDLSKYQFMIFRFIILVSKIYDGEVWDLFMFCILSILGFIFWKMVFWAWVLLMQFDNISVLRTNAMKYLPNYFEKGQVCCVLFSVHIFASHTLQFVHLTVDTCFSKLLYLCHFFLNVICSCRRCSSCFLILISKRKTIGAESSGIILPECHILLKIQKKPRNSIQFLLHIFIIVFKFADHFYQA